MSATLSEWFSIEMKNLFFHIRRQLNALFFADERNIFSNTNIENFMLSSLFLPFRENLEKIIILLRSEFTQY